MGSNPAEKIDARFFTIADSGYFPGVVALVNSLRLTGHSQEIVVLDCGLTTRQRAALQPHCTLVDKPASMASNPMLYKPFAARFAKSGVVVLVDSDMIITRPLDELIERAAAGAVVAFADPESDRFFAQWKDVFELAHTLRRQTYLNAGFVAYSVDHFPRLLEQWWEACGRILNLPTLYEGAADAPTTQGDQDALNALLMSEYADTPRHLPPPQTAPQGGDLRAGVTIENEQALTCSYCGHETFLLHSSAHPKPWRRGGWRMMRAKNAYTHLMTRLLLSRDLCTPLQPDQIPRWLRGGWSGRFLAIANRLIDVLMYRFRLARLMGKRSFPCPSRRK